MSEEVKRSVGAVFGELVKPPIWEVSVLETRKTKALKSSRVRLASGVKARWERRGPKGRRYAWNGPWLELKD